MSDFIKLKKRLIFKLYRYYSEESIYWCIYVV